MSAWPLGTVNGAARLRTRIRGGRSLTWTVEELRAASGATLARLWNEEME